ncbi:sulfotransferase family protein [Dyadobacter bucti]|uniref:sulfotransferase family protein n=1 Tax=Dyadobacter bucti TaxID=2572203 RepID=UPI001109DC57|nr:sulfotransferase [Dyadobacter bucti]
MTFTPVQMIGTQRSGSNLLRLMLNQLKGVSAPHPPHILERLMPLLPAYGDLEIPGNFETLIADVCTLVETNPVPWTGVTLNQKVILDRCETATLPEITRVVYELKAESEGAHIWMCKSMANIRYADELEKYDPKPLYVHLFRDGRDVALSFKKAIVGEKHIYHIARQWKEEQDASVDLYEKLGGDRVIQLRYEDLLQNPQAELKRLCGFLDVEYSESAMAYHESDESKETANSGLMWQNVVKPVLADNHHKFLKELSQEDIRIFERVAGDTLETLGYELQFGRNQSPFREEEIAGFTEINEQLKAEFRKKLRPEDLEKRRGQEELLKSVRARM